MIRRARNHEGTRREQPDRDRNETRVNHDAPVRILEAIEYAADEERDQAARRAHRGGRDQRARNAGAIAIRSAN